jgi:hypothetical protein
MVNNRPSGENSPNLVTLIYKSNACQACLFQRKKNFKVPSPVQNTREIPYLARVARFFLVQNTKTGKNIPNCHKMYQMAIKYFQWP